MQMLARDGVDMPVTGFAHSTKDIAGLLEQVGGTPVVIKLLEGTQGIGVILAENRKAAEAVIEAFMLLDANILVQEFIEEADATDIRCFVVGDRVVAAMKRVGEPGEYRSNLHRGGTAEAVILTPDMERVALDAARAVGLNIAGVDLLPSKRGPLVMEVNSSPGLEGVEAATEIDVAGEIIDFIERRTGSSFGTM
jgi:ribosomal protein S6--L-glutamate ligase